MSVAGVDEARRALRRRAPAELVGLRECAWLDVKSGPYRLTSLEGKEELAKDVAAFANAPTGGLLLVGYQTDLRDGEEIVSGVGPIPRASVDLDQHRKLIRSRVMPPPRDLEISWIDCGEERGILVIDIPRQPSSMLPFVVPGPSGKNKAGEYSLAVPVREADAAHWLPQSEIRRLLALGWAASDGPSDEVLSARVAKAVSAANSATEPPPPSYDVGAGVPGWKHQFREVYDQVRQQSPLGKPLTEVYRDGPGVVQRVESNESADGWLLCALPGRRPIVVVESVWEALHTAGSGVPNGDVLGALGIPIIDQPGARSGQIINEQANVVALSGGHWGNGCLVRVDGGQSWSWEPVPGFALDVTQAARNWTGGATPPQLRVRAVATLPWVWARGRRISTSRRRELADNLPISHLAGALTVLSQRRGADLRAATWSPGPNRNGLDAASYSTAIMAPNGHRTALCGEVMIALPNSISSAVVTCAELRVDDVAAWADALRTAGGPELDLRLSLEELVEFFTVAWTTATEVLPALVSPDPYDEHWVAPPTVELRLSTEHQQGPPGPPPRLAELVDFTAFGYRGDNQLTEMAVTITAPPRLVRSARRDLTRRAMVHMGQAFGFLDAAVDRL